MTHYFVGGAQRTGTTLLQSVLCSAPETNPLIREAKYFRLLVQAYWHGRARLRAETADYFEDLEELQSFHMDVVHELLRHLHERFNVEHLVLKDPDQTRLFPEICELIPEAKCLCLVRDPRDTIASLINVGKRFAEGGIDNAPLTALLRGRNIKSLCAHYLSYYRRLLRKRAALEPAHLLFVRYEDLVGETGATLDKIAAFTELDLASFDPGQPRALGAYGKMADDPYNRCWLSDTQGQAFTTARVGAYSATLSGEEATAIKAVCKPLMDAFNYD